ncbi:MAG TPA: hydantoinase/oxoprolinase N-terminal domain-containing protein, partial [Candidatus Baltobacteraceae bacterium]
MVRIGIDVGGTFTDVVAIDTESRSIVARIKVPTTHSAETGVAAGIIQGLQLVLQTPALQGQRIAFIAHSTTQATNALLEGDVARVGVVGLFEGQSWLARLQLRLPPLVLAENALLRTQTAYARADDVRAVGLAFERLLGGGVEAIAISEAFGVDRPRYERAAVALARERGIPATAGHEVSSLYGLRARTRTAVLNAAILPVMMRTSAMTARAVQEAGVGVPLMVMRSDGGVMDVREMARRP